MVQYLSIKSVIITHTMVSYAAKITVSIKKKIYLTVDVYENKRNVHMSFSDSVSDFLP